MLSGIPIVNDVRQDGYVDQWLELGSETFGYVKQITRFIYNIYSQKSGNGSPGIYAQSQVLCARDIECQDRTALNRFKFECRS